MLGSLRFTRLLRGLLLLQALTSATSAGEFDSLAANSEPGPSAVTDREKSTPGEFGIEIGALTFVGTDLQLFYRITDSPWMIGYRYLDYEDDFISIDADNTDRETLTLSGPFVRYLLSPGRGESWYLAGGLYRATQKIECFGVSDEDSASGPFFGGGRMGRRDTVLSYNIGLMLSPAMSLQTDTGDCSSESNGSIDAVASMMFIFD